MMIFASFDKYSPSCFEAPWQIAAAPVIRAESSGAAMLIVKCRVAVIMRWPTVALRLYFEVRQNIAKPDPSENTNTLFIIVLWSWLARETEYNSDDAPSLVKRFYANWSGFSEDNWRKNKCLKYTNLHLLLFCTVATVSISSPELGIVRESQYLQTHLDTRHHHPFLRECPM